MKHYKITKGADNNYVIKARGVFKYHKISINGKQFFSSVEEAQDTLFDYMNGLGYVVHIQYYDDED